MPNWAEIVNELQDLGSPHDVVRRKYLDNLHDLTGRNVIAYYSGWLQGRDGMGAVDDNDLNGFMNAIHKMDRKKGLDLILHTPGGDAAATESLVRYLHLMFDRNIRAIVPQLAMSAGTMIACACKSIVMGKQSSLGPIDPQLNGLPAHGVVEEFERAKKEIKQDNSNIPIWQPIISRYYPTLIGECEKAIKWANEMVTDWLVDGMLAGQKKNRSIAAKIVKELGDHALTKSHARHLNVVKCKEIGLKIEELESDGKLQDAVLSVHHAMMTTFAGTPAIKIIQNHKGDSYIIMPMNLKIGKRIPE